MTKYIRFRIQNIQPLRIADDSSSQSGQTSTLKYIPGSAVRGYVINNLCRDPEFNSMKKFLFSDKVRFMNCCAERGGYELMPPIKGFYEDKKPADVNGEKHIENVTIKGSFHDGFKRASLGSACRIADKKIYYYHIDTGSDLKIRIKVKDRNDKQNVFRSEYILPGNIFVGYIAIDAEADKAGNTDDLAMKVFCKISGTIKDSIILGNARTSGMGKCRVLNKEELNEEEYFQKAEKKEYHRISGIPEKPAENTVYMILLSNTVMRDEYGRYCGLNLKKLEEQMKVSDLKIAQCSTSVVNVRGYNSHLHLKLPSVTMYERGSVFHFTFTGIINPDTLKDLVRTGIGIRRNEGFGQVMFMGREYETVEIKAEAGRTDIEMSADILVKNDDSTLKILAANYLRMLIRKIFDQKIIEQADNFAKGASNSQKGSVRALLLANKYNYDKAQESLKNYFNHAAEKQKKQNVQNERASISDLEKFVTDTLKIKVNDLVTLNDDKSIMGIPVSALLSDADFGMMKIQYILDLMQYDNRKGA